MKNSARATQPAGREALLVFYFGVFVPVGGVERFAINLLNGLSDLGSKAKLVCSARPEWLPQDMRFQWLRAPYVPGSLYHVSDWLLLFFRGWYEVRRASSVVFGKMPPALILRILRICRGPKTRFIFVTPYAPIAATPEEANRLRRSLELFDVVVVQAEAFRQTLLDVGVQTPIKVVPYPLDENIKRLQVTGLPPGPPWRIGFLGRLEPQKTVDTLFEALSAMGRTDLELHLYGSGSQQQRLQNLAETHPMAGRIFFHGAIPYAAVPKAVMENHLFAFSSREEGQVLAALEILACGRPIAATPAGALAEILADRRLGFCAETCGSAPLAAALLDVLAKLKTRSLTPETIREAFDQRWNRPSLLAEYAQLLEAS
jgi:glycosyltransferase involved in cell wall biosynthesis